MTDKKDFPLFVILMIVCAVGGTLAFIFQSSPEAEAAINIPFEIPAVKIEQIIGNPEESHKKLARQWIKAFNTLEHDLPINVTLARGNYIETIENVFNMSNNRSLVIIRYKKDNYHDHSVMIAIASDILGITNNP